MVPATRPCPTRDLPRRLTAREDVAEKMRKRGKAALALQGSWLADSE